MEEKMYVKNKTIRILLQPIIFLKIKRKNQKKNSNIPLPVNFINKMYLQVLDLKNNKFQTMDHQLKSSRPASIRTAETLNDTTYACQHSWKCFVNPTVNLHYHQIMIARNSTNKFQTARIFRPTSCSPSSLYSTKKKQVKNWEYPQSMEGTKKKISKNLQNQYGIESKNKEQVQLGIQTTKMVVIEPETYEMQEEQRKYLRNKFIDHYGIRHKKKF